MTPGIEPPLPDRVLGWVPFIASAALVAYGVHLALDSPAWGLVIGLLALGVVVPSYVQRRRLRRLLTSGDVEAILASWENSLGRIPHPETMAPLIAATALAAHGFVGRARQTLDRAHRGAAWDAAIEHRLVVEMLLDAFEGERQRALETAELLGKLPLPTSPWLRARVTELRRAMGAFARAFAHQSRRADMSTLSHAARENPLVHWALRYAAAVACVDHGKRGAARKLIDSAPAWPAESVFSVFHAEIASQLESS